MKSQRQPTRSGHEDHACPEKVWPNSDSGWLGREPTTDEADVVAWIKGHRLPSRVLHVGVGNALLSHEFGPRVVQGLTRDGGEAEAALESGLETLVCNKYDVTSYEHLLERNIDCVVDVNIRSYACCDAHFLAYMHLLGTALTPRGYLLTTRGGLGYRVPTSLKELRSLCPCWTVRDTGNVVKMQLRKNSRVERWKRSLGSLFSR